MAFNDSYAEQGRAFAGMLATISQDKDVASYVQGEASAGMSFGTFIAEGTASTLQGTPDKAIKMVDANSKVAGLLLQAHSHPPDQIDANGLVLPKNMIDVLREGEAYARLEGTCTKGNNCYVRHTANGGNTLIGTVADGSGTGLVLFRGAQFAETKAANGDGLVKVKVDVRNVGAVAGLT